MVWWMAINVDYDAAYSPTKFKSLKMLCIDSLISDVYLFRDLTGAIPYQLHDLLLRKAMRQGSGFSTYQLMKYFPGKEFVMHYPEPLMTTTLFSTRVHTYARFQAEKILSFTSIEEFLRFSVYAPRRQEAYVLIDEMESVTNSAEVLLSIFFHLIQEKCETSKLRIVDLNNLLIDGELIETLCSFIRRRLSKGITSNTAEYTLKTGITVKSLDYIEQICQIVEAGDSIGMKILLTGLAVACREFREDYLLELMDKLPLTEFTLFSFHFYDPIPVNALMLMNVFSKLRNFRNISVLNITQIPFAVIAELGKLFHLLAETLYELRHLTRLRLQGCKLTAAMENLLTRHCSRREKQGPAPLQDLGCCLLHRGTLECLDISSCNLLDRDIQFFKEPSLSKKLKNLNISYNHFDPVRLENSLKELSSSLVVLDMERCMEKDTLLEFRFPSLTSLSKLKCLNIIGFYSNSEALQPLAAELRELPELNSLALSIPIGGRKNCQEFELLLNSEKRINIFWM